MGIAARDLRAPRRASGAAASTTTNAGRLPSAVEGALARPSTGWPRVARARRQPDAGIEDPLDQLACVRHDIPSSQVGNMS